MDLRELKTQLNENAETLARNLFPQGVKKGNEWRVGNLDGDPGDSLGVHLSGDKKGVWSDFSTGESGRMFELVLRTKRLTLPEGIAWSKKFLNVTDTNIQTPGQVHNGKPARTYRRPDIDKRKVHKPASKVKEYLLSRGLTEQTIAEFQLGEEAGRTFKDAGVTSDAIVFPFKAGGELKMVKWLGVDRVDRPGRKPKKLIEVTYGCEPILFGWQSLSDTATSAVICEGELNAMSWHQVGIPALATPFGAGKGAKHEWISQDWERLERFDTLYLNFDPDVAGKEAIADLVDRLGRHRCRIVPPFPDNQDANDCLKAGILSGLTSEMLGGAESLDPSELKSASEFTQGIIEYIYPVEGTHLGVPLPIPGFGDKLALRRGEMTIVTGYRGHAKTEAVNWMVNAAVQAGEKALVASFEMRGRILLGRAVRQVTAARMPSVEYIKQVVEWWDGKLWIFDHVGSANPDRVFEVFDYARRRYGVTFFVIDSLMKFGLAEDDLTGQARIANQYSNFCNQYNVHGILVAHARKDANEDHIPNNNSVKGSGGITDMAHNVLVIWRNKMKERAVQKSMRGEELTRDEERAMEKSDAIWSVDKQREGDGWIGDIPAWFDVDSKQFLPDRDARPMPLIPFNAMSAAADADPDVISISDIPQF